MRWWESSPQKRAAVTASSIVEQTGEMDSTTDDEVISTPQIEFLDLGIFCDRRDKLLAVKYGHSIRCRQDVVLGRSSSIALP